MAAAPTHYSLFITQTAAASVQRSLFSRAAENLLRGDSLN